MKTRPLPDQDLARIAPLPHDMKLIALRQMKLKRPPYSYRPVRGTGLDILNVSPGGLVSGVRAPLSVIEAEIQRHAKSLDELEANLAVGRALHLFAEEKSIAGRREEFFPLPIGTGQKVSYWYPAVIGIDDAATVVFIDFRRTKTLTKEARKFVFSIMHERIRAADPDTYGSVKLGIISFASPEKTTRVARLVTDDEFELYDFDTLDRLVRETYELWHQVLDERVEEVRRRDEGLGPLFGT